MGEYFGAYTQTVIRSLLVAVGLLPIVLLCKWWKPVQLRRDARLLLLGFAATAFVGGPMYYAVLHAGVGVSLAICYVGIVVGMFFFGWLMNKERYGKDKWLSTVLGIAGLALVFSPSMHTAGMLALGAALVSGLATALDVVVSKKLPYSASQTTLIMWLVAVPANLPFIFLFGEPLPKTGWDMEWLYLFCFAAVSLAASWLVTRGVKLIEAGAAGILGLLEIVFGVLFGVLLFSERPAGIVLLGMTSIVAAAAIPYVQHYNTQKGTLEP